MLYARFEDRNNQAIYIRPHHVVMFAAQVRADDSDVTIIWTIDGNHANVKGDVEFVARKLESVFDRKERP